MVVLPQVVESDWATTSGKCCDSALFSLVWFVTILVNDLTYRIQSTALVVEFLWQSSSSVVASREPHILSNLEGHIVTTSIFWLPYLGFQQVLPPKVVSLFYPWYSSVCQYVRRDVWWGCQSLELHWRVVVVIGPEWCHPLWVVDGIVVRKLC